MTLILFRDLPGIAAVEHQLDLQFRDRLLDDELEELPHLLDETSAALFGITRQDTFYWVLPEPVRGRYNRVGWEMEFALLSQYSRDPNAPWRAFDLDVRCPRGGRLHCFELFGRQLVCALRGLHPQAVLPFADRKKAA